ncbi:hypothetical protein STEG23_025677 [Scotinomys teguina]
MQSSRSSSSLPHVDITHIMQTSRAAARRHQVAAAHSSALQRERWRAGTERDRERQAGAHQGEEREKERSKSIDVGWRDGLDVKSTDCSPKGHECGIHRANLRHCSLEKAEEWALLNSSQKKLYSGVMKETFLNLIFVGTAIEEKLGEDCKDLRRKMRTQVIEKECEYACDNDCDKNQNPVPENIINIDMYPIERTQPGENLDENDLTRDTYGQNGEVIHTEVKQFIGQFCEEASSDSSDLVNHGNSHIGKKRAICRQSSKTFKYPKYFEKHEVAVTGEKPYECEHCGKDFSERSICTRHERIHTAEKLFALI